VTVEEASKSPSERRGPNLLTVVPPSTREVFGGKRMIPDGRLDLLIVSTSGSQAECDQNLAD
jgi:hypothetical protein